MAKPRHYSALSVTDISAKGHGVAKADKRVVFVKNAVPGDVVDVRVIGRKKKALLAEIDALVTPSPQRISPRCQHFLDCGGCKLQNFDYAAQLEYKQRQVHEALTRIAGLEGLDIQPILPAEPHYNYRNKVEFTFSNKRWLTQSEIEQPQDYDRRALGFHVPNFFDKVLDIDECHLHEDRLNALRNEIRDYARTHDLPFFDIREQTGFLRNLVMRTSVTTGEVLVMLIVFEDRPGLVQQLFTHLAERFDFVTDWLWLHNPKKNDSYSELAPQIWRGKGYITEKLGDYTFKISPTSFFQTNTRQGERLYKVVREFAGEGRSEPVELLYDLYCGTGTIGIFCEALAERVVGIEYNQASVDDADENAALNGLSDKMSFHAGDMAKLLTPSFFDTHGRPQTLLCDPPRAGMGDKVCQRILEAAPQRIVYVSCKPSTQARDLEQLLPAYRVTRVQPVDMFPHTTHVENVVVLERK